MKKFFKILLIIFIVLIVILGVIAGFIYSKLNKINYVDIPKEDINVNSGIEEKLTDTGM